MKGFRSNAPSLLLLFLQLHLLRHHGLVRLRVLGPQLDLGDDLRRVVRMRRDVTLVDPVLVAVGLGPISRISFSRNLRIKLPKGSIINILCRQYFPS
jgi:hypothetical protein